MAKNSFSKKIPSFEEKLEGVKYVKNYDGDTVTVNIPKLHPLIGEKINIRIKDIDTAEIKASKPCEKAIAIHTREVVKNLLQQAKKIELRNPSRGKYFRIVADLWFDGANLKDILLAEKLAIPYDGKKKPDYDWCSRP